MTDIDRGNARPDGPGHGLGASAINGAVILGGAQGVKFVTQMISTVVLARLLSPHDFGIFAMIMPLVGFVMLFQDFGLSQAVISVRGVDLSQETTLFYINLALSGGLALAFLAAAPIMAHFYGTNEVIAPAMVLAGTIALSGLATLQFGFLVRDLRFTAVATADMVGAIAGVTAAIVVAVIYPSPWAMVASVVANMLFGLACGWIATGWRPGRPAPIADIRQLLNFGGGVIGANLANYVTRNADNILIARFLGTNPLGYYDRAYKLLLFPFQQIVSPLGRIVIPILSRFVDEAQRYRAAYFRSLEQILLVALPGMAAAIVMADDLIPFVMGEKWRPVIPVFRWLGLVGLHLPLSQTLPWLLISQSRTRSLARFAVFQAVTSVIGFVIGLRYGVIGVAAIYALTDLLLRLPLMIWYVGRTGPVSGSAITRHISVHILGVVLASALLLAFRTAVPLDHFPALVVGTILAYVVAWGTVALFPSRRLLFVELANMGIKPLRALRRRSPKSV